jgi:hypothetical protein
MAHGNAKVDNLVSVSLEECEREMSLLLCRIDLLKSGVHGVKSSMSVHETLALLLFHGLYQRATSLSVQFEIPLDSIFKSLALLCGKLQLGYVSTSAKGLFDLEMEDRGRSLLECAWERLRDYLSRYDGVETDFKYHKIAADELLNLDRRFVHLTSVDIPPPLFVDTVLTLHVL